MKTGKRKFEIDVGRAAAGVSWFPDGRRILLVTAGRPGGRQGPAVPGTAQVRTPDGELVMPGFEVPGVGALCWCAVSRAVDGKSFLAIGTGPEAGAVHVAWGTESKGKRSWVLDPPPGGPSFVMGVGFNPSGTQLATCYADGALRVWEFESHEWRLAWSRPKNDRFLNPPTYSPDGEFLAVSWLGDTGAVLDARTGEPRAHLKPRLGLARAVCFTNSGKLVGALGDETLRLLPFRREELLRLAGEKLARAKAVAGDSR
jgi:WD40 repeat protein